MSRPLLQRLQLHADPCLVDLTVPASPLAVANNGRESVVAGHGMRLAPGLESLVESSLPQPRLGETEVHVRVLCVDSNGVLVQRDGGIELVATEQVIRLQDGEIRAARIQFAGAPRQLQRVVGPAERPVLDASARENCGSKSPTGDARKRRRAVSAPAQSQSKRNAVACSIKSASGSVGSIARACRMYLLTCGHASVGRSRPSTTIIA